jgi:hypothetical protein
MRDFDKQVVQWAKRRFGIEINTDFERIQTFDFPANLRLLSMLRNLSGADLELLAQTLPLQVLNAKKSSDSPLLTPKQIVLINNLRADLDTDYRKNFSEDLKIINLRHKKDIKFEFNKANKDGIEVIKQTAAKWGCDYSHGARGEWALIVTAGQIRITYSFKLSRWMELQYGISIADSLSSISIRSGAQYLGDLGLGGGSWLVKKSTDLTAKLLNAIEFASWHANEYKLILK